jgi:uncharacterized membrane protein YeaQ/YmgE (transglycosylase-associated protein family)
MEWLTLVAVLVLALLAMRIVGAVYSLLSTLVLGMVVGLLTRSTLPAARKPGLLATAQAGAAGGFIGQLLAWTVWRQHGLFGPLLLEIVGASVAVALLGVSRLLRR